MILFQVLAWSSHCLLMLLFLSGQSYDSKFLRIYPELPPTPLQLEEDLEQLKVLENGYKMKVFIRYSDTFLIMSHEHMVILPMWVIAIITRNLVFVETMGISLKEEGRELGEVENRKEKSGKLFLFFLSFLLGQGQWCFL